MTCQEITEEPGKFMIQDLHLQNYVKEQESLRGRESCLLDILKAERLKEVSN